MAPYLFFFLFSILGLSYGTYTDFKERMVSNKVTYGMVAIGLGGHAILAFLGNDLMILGNSVAVTIATFAAAYLLYKIGMWAGGDVKLFTGLAAMNPFNPNILTSLGIISIPAFQSITIPIFPLTLFMFSLFAMLPYGAMLAAARLLKNEEEKKKFKKEGRKRAIQAFEVSAAAIGLSAVLLLYGQSQWLVLPALFLFALIPGKARFAGGIILLITGLWLEGAKAGQQFATLFALFFGFYLLLKLYKLSKILMRKPVKISELEEGMISAQTIIRNGKNIGIAPELEIKKLIKDVASNRLGKAIEMLKPKGEEIVSSKSAGGLTVQQIKELKRLAGEKKIGNTLMIKESAPFVPAVLIAFIALNIVGDVIWFWL